MLDANELNNNDKLMINDDLTDELINAMNLFNAQSVANTIIEQLNIANAPLDNEHPLTFPIEGTGINIINDETIPLIARCLLDTIACLIATLIDAGSERDAVNESDELLNALTNELNEWTK